ncbi:MAG: 16S rRNA (cytidine(1402)-2'-O)-methyltransferase [Gammaproteobacteria bacterium]
MSLQTGILYVVATPIGNLDDLSARAVATLELVAVIAAEDTRRSGRLLSHLGIKTELLSWHEHNEGARVPELLARLRAGEDIALISDAGTPLISDPGYRLVQAAIDEGIKVCPVPGCSAVMAALSVAGLPTDEFLFAGFLPASNKKRESRLMELAELPATLIVFESVHRIADSLQSMISVLGADRRAIAARELTKLHESIYRGTLAELLEQVQESSGADKGEYTLVVSGAENEPAGDAELDRVLTVLLGYLGVRQAADAAAKILGTKKNAAYKRALEIRESSDDAY